MSTSVQVSTYSTAHTITHVTKNIVNHFKEIIREIGLDPAQFVEVKHMAVLERGINAWLNSKDLVRLTLEVFTPAGKLITRWDIDVNYAYSGDGTLWADRDAIRYHIQKAGGVPSTSLYGMVCTTKPGAPKVEGWSDTELKDTSGFQRLGVGSTIGGVGMSAEASYWTKR